LNQHVRPAGSAEFSDDALPVCLGAVVDKCYDNAINVEGAHVDERRAPSGGWEESDSDCPGLPGQNPGPVGPARFRPGARGGFGGRTATLATEVHGQGSGEPLQVAAGSPQWIAIVRADGGLGGGRGSAGRGAPVPARLPIGLQRLSAGPTGRTTPD
jgi:hypothetical protein